MVRVFKRKIAVEAFKQADDVLILCPFADMLKDLVLERRKLQVLQLINGSVYEIVVSSCNPLDGAVDFFSVKRWLVGCSANGVLAAVRGAPCHTFYSH
jgi:hypothetical protein